MSQTGEPKPRDLNRWNRAQKVVEEEGVKLHRFRPSGLEIWTVAGRDCDYLVDCTPSADRKPYCSCQDFYFRVMSATVPECYHLVAARKAIELGMYSVTDHDDQEFEDFMKNLLTNVFAHIS